jgi:hypothetical protein
MQLRLAMPHPSASWDEVDELLGHADSRVVQEVVETGASIDEIGAAIDSLSANADPETSRVAQVRRIIEGMRRGLDDEGTMPIGGTLI